MFGRKAPAPCDNWLGLRQYNDDKSISKVVWVDKQFEKIVQANKRALKSIQARAKVNERSSGDKEFRHSHRESCPTSRPSGRPEQDSRRLQAGSI